MPILRVLAVIAVALSSHAALAHDFTKVDIKIGHPWTRATPGGATIGVGYLKITNTGKEADKLTGGSFDGAANVEVHEMKMEGDVMKMRLLAGGVEIKPGETIEFKPSSYHLMFTGLKEPIAIGPTRKGTLTFEKTGAIDVTYKIETFGAADSTAQKP